MSENKSLHDAYDDYVWDKLTAEKGTCWRIAVYKDGKFEHYQGTMLHIDKNDAQYCIDYLMEEYSKKGCTFKLVEFNFGKV